VAKQNSKSKQPAIKEQPSRAKTPAAVAVPDYNDTKACWRIGKLRMADPYGWHVVNPAEVARIRIKLATLEANTWQEIFIRDARFNHRIPANELKCPTARKWMKDNMPDQPYLWTLRLSGAERVWGIFSDGAYQIVFWDPDHLIWEVTR
jgi:hypothetical protein